MRPQKKRFSIYLIPPGKDNCLDGEIRHLVVKRKIMTASFVSISRSWEHPDQDKAGLHFVLIASLNEALFREEADGFIFRCVRMVIPPASLDFFPGHQPFTGMRPSIPSLAFCKIMGK